VADNKEEVVKRIAAITATLAEKQLEVERLTSTKMRAQIALEEADKSLVQIRKQLAGELAKLDPGFKCGPATVANRPLAEPVA